MGSGRLCGRVLGADAWWCSHGESGVKLEEAVMARFQAGYQKRDPERARANRTAMSVNLTAERIETLVQASMTIDSGLLRQQLTAWTGGHPLGRAPSTISAKVCMVTTEDTFFTKSMLENMATRFANVELEHISNAGHWVHAEQPDSVAEVLLRRLFDWRLR